jgi:hypothetical protein
MAEDRDGRETSLRQLIPWMQIFRGFRIAIDPSKLLLAAAGIFVMAFGWWLLSVVFGTFYKSDPPDWERDNYRSRYETTPPNTEMWKEFQEDRASWNLMHRAAGLGEGKAIEPADLAQSPEELKVISDAYKEAGNRGHLAIEQDLVERGISPDKAHRMAEALGKPKRGGALASWPWSEDRGPNPYLLATGQAGVPWEAGHLGEWFISEQAPVLIEPLAKLFSPVIYYFNKNAGPLLRSYFLTVMLWTVATWSLFGGAITRIAVVQIARDERLSAREALGYSFKRIMSYLIAPVVPLAIILGILVIMIIFGFFHMIPVFGDIFVSGLFWWMMLLMGLVIAVAVIALLGWPMMVNAISAEGTDSWEAVTRSLTYVFQRPWQYAWYGLVAIAYGAVVIFVVGFLGSFAVYLSKWGVSQTFWIESANREPSFLFAYSPTSFGWRTMLLDGATVNGEQVVQNGQIDPSLYKEYVSGNSPDSLRWWNKVGAGMVAIWTGVVFLLVVGFGYSFFWSASSIIYMLLRRTVDHQEMDEVYFEEEDEIAPFTTPAPTSTPTTHQPLTMVEPPAPKPEPVATTPPAPTPSPAPPPGPAAVTPPKPAPTPSPEPEPTPEPASSEGTNGEKPARDTSEPVGSDGSEGPAGAGEEATKTSEDDEEKPA